MQGSIGASGVSQPSAWVTGCVVSPGSGTRWSGFGFSREELGQGTVSVMGLKSAQEG